jgi:hypothetical protein
LSAIQNTKNWHRKFIVDMSHGYADIQRSVICPQFRIQKTGIESS